jgi:hypothetical protein
MRSTAHRSENASLCHKSAAIEIRHRRSGQTAANDGYCLLSPRRWATAAASPRVATPSLARMRETCRLAVFSVMNNSRPICRLVRPSATSDSTSVVSRRVSPSDPVGDGGGVGASGAAWLCQPQPAAGGKEFDLPT